MILRDSKKAGFMSIPEAIEQGLVPPLPAPAALDEMITAFLQETTNNDSGAAIYPSIRILPRNPRQHFVMFFEEPKAEAFELHDFFATEDGFAVVNLTYKGRYWLYEDEFRGRLLSLSANPRRPWHLVWLTNPWVYNDELRQHAAAIAERLLSEPLTPTPTIQLLANAK